MVESPDTGHSGFEQASWAFSIIGGTISIITLASIIVLLAQISVQRRNIEDAKVERVVGKWRSVITLGDGFGIRSSASIPLISLRQLVSQEYRMAPSRLVSPKEKPALSGWVNFLDVLGIIPDEFRHSVHTFQAESLCTPGFGTERIWELVEMRLPMRWDASEFVCLCSLLGFQQKSGARDDYDRTVLPLPALWYGPPGKLVLRESTAGIVVSFRPQTYEKNILPNVVHESVKPVKFSLRNRAFQAVQSLPISKEQALFIGGGELYDEGVEPSHGKLLWGVEVDKIYKTVESDLLQIWGLDCKSIVYLKHRLIHENSEPVDVFPMGEYRAPKDILPLIKAALLNLIPDGYIFTSHQRLSGPVDHLMNHSYDAGSDLCKFYALAKWELKYRPVNRCSKAREKLAGGLKTLAAIYSQFTQKKALMQATLTPSDCQTIAQLTEMLHEILGNEDSGKQLRWAMVSSRTLVQALVDGIRFTGLENVMRASGVIDEEYFSSQDLLGPKRFAVPNASQKGPMPPFIYTGEQILAAVISFFLTGIWICTGTPNNISYEALCVPESVFMI